jgi:hypothetical protein
MSDSIHQIDSTSQKEVSEQTTGLSIGLTTGLSSGLSKEVEKKLPQTISLEMLQNEIGYDDYYVAEDDEWKAEDVVYGDSEFMEKHLNGIQSCDKNDINPLVNDAVEWIESNRDDNRNYYVYVLRKELKSMNNKIVREQKAIVRSDTDFMKIISKVDDYGGDHTTVKLIAEANSYILEFAINGMIEFYEMILSERVHTRNQYFVKTLLKLICSETKKDPNGDNSWGIVYLDDEEMTNEKKDIVATHLANVSLDHQMLSYCSAPGCGCVDRSSVLTTFSSGNISMKTFKYLIEQKFIHVDTDEMKDWCFRCLTDMFSSCGNCTGTSVRADRIHERTMYFMKWLSEQCPIDMINYRDPIYNQCLMRLAISGQWEEKYKEYVEFLWNMSTIIYKESNGANGAWFFTKTTDEPVGHGNYDSELASMKEYAGAKKYYDAFDGKGGQTMFYWFARNGWVDLLREICQFALETNQCLDTYNVSFVCGDLFINSHNNAPSKKVYCFMTIIMEILCGISQCQSPDFLQESADCIEVLLQNGVSASHPIVYFEMVGSNDDAIKPTFAKTMELSVRDFLKLYKFDYNGSPIMNILGPHIFDQELHNIPDDFEVCYGWLEQKNPDELIEKIKFDGCWDMQPRSLRWDSKSVLEQILHFHRNTKDPATLALVKEHCLDFLLNKFMKCLPKFSAAVDMYNKVKNAYDAHKTLNGYDWEQVNVITKEEDPIFWKLNLANASGRREFDSIIEKLNIKSMFGFSQRHNWKFAPHIKQFVEEYETVVKEFCIIKKNMHKSIRNKPSLQI